MGAGANVAAPTEGVSRNALAGKDEAGRTAGCVKEVDTTARPSVE